MGPGGVELGNATTSAEHLEALKGFYFLAHLQELGRLLHGGFCRRLGAVLFLSSPPDSRALCAGNFCGQTTSCLLTVRHC